MSGSRSVNQGNTRRNLALTDAQLNGSNWRGEPSWYLQAAAGAISVPSRRVLLRRFVPYSWRHKERGPRRRAFDAKLHHRFLTDARSYTLDGRGGIAIAQEFASSWGMIGFPAPYASE